MPVDETTAEAPPDTVLRLRPGLAIEQLTDAHLPIIFGRYELQEMLGEGGMARVFRAELRGPAGFRKPVALKIMKPRIGGHTNPRGMLDLVREACLGGRLKHHHIVDVYELGEVNGQHFISMELVDGLTLSNLVRIKKSIPGSVVMEIAVAMASGLAKAHGLESDGQRVRLVHRDLKPANILLSSDGAVKIADFGIAITRGWVSDSDDEAASPRYGTPSYMSPEQVMGEELDGRSDLFSLALVIATMVLGRNPLGNRWAMKRLRQGLTLESPLLEPDHISKLNRAVPGLGRVLLRCLEPDRVHRYPDAASLGEALQTLQETVGYTPRLERWLGQVLAPRETRASREAPATQVNRTKAADTEMTAVPPPQALRSNLGPPLDAFVGRVSDLADLERRFSEGARLVTLRGTGGAGKTRVSRQIARRAAEDLRGGAWFVDLTEARSAVGVVHATAEVLDVPLGSADDVETLVAKVGHAIAGRGPLLLVLDNFEQVVEHAPVTVGRWMDLATEARFLVTSREPLRLAGEQVFPLAPLSEKEGVKLFELRASDAGCQWGEPEESRQAIIRIVQELDGLPLAIELAAARARLLSPTQILSRLSERFQLLQGGQRGRTGRLASLRGLIDWSWELLEPWEQAALAQLSVFRGGFVMEAAEEVLDLSSWTHAPWFLDVVGSLLDKSLLHSREVLGQPRFGMYVSIHAYAAEKLAVEDPPLSGLDSERIAKLRHSRLYARYGSEAFIESLGTHGGVGRRKALALELENLLAGVEHGLALGELEAMSGCALAASELLQMRGPFSHGLALLERVAAQPICEATQERLGRKTAWMLALTGQVSRALEYYQQTLATAREEGNRRLESINLADLGNLFHDQGRLEEATEHYHQAVVINRELENRANEHIILGNLAVLYRDQGRIEEAQEYYRQASRRSREVGDRRAEGVHLGNLAILYRDQGRVAEALGHYQQALQIHREVGDRRSEGLILGQLAVLHRLQGRTTAALENYNQALDIAREVGDLRYESVHLGNLGDLLLDQGYLTAAETHFQQAIEIGDEVLPLAAAVFRGSLALIRAQKGAFDEARELLARGEELLRSMHKLELGKLLCKQARVEHLAGDPGAVAAALAAAEAVVLEMGARPDSELAEAIAEAKEHIAK